MHQPTPETYGVVVELKALKEAGYVLFNDLLAFLALMPDTLSMSELDFVAKLMVSKIEDRKRRDGEEISSFDCNNYNCFT